MAPEKAIIISTHILEEVEAICTRAVVIARGRVVADATPAELAKRSRWHNAVTVVVPAERGEAAAQALRKVERLGAVEVAARGGDGSVALSALPRDGGPVEGAVREALGSAGIAPREMFIERGRLDEVFRELTMREAA
jgi:ABC-2 type transport system ATP-binding protein